MRSMWTMMPWWLAGCTPTPEVTPASTTADPPAPVIETAPPPANGPDADDDGLSDADEADWGTDPGVPDTDADGWTDGYEVWDHTDPLDDGDHPYTGGWHIGACRDDIVSSGNAVGQIAEDFVLTDQFGEDLRLHDFCDRQVLLVSAATWCGPCQLEADDLQHWFETYETAGFIVITLIGEDNGGGIPTRADAEAWVEAFDLTHPVVVDPQWRITARFTGYGELLLPANHQLAAGLEVLQVDTLVSEAAVQAALP